MAAIQQFCRHRHIYDGVNGVVKIRISLEMKDIFNVAGGKIIEDKNLAALSEKIFRLMRAINPAPPVIRAFIGLGARNQESEAQFVNHSCCNDRTSVVVVFVQMKKPMLLRRSPSTL